MFKEFDRRYETVTDMVYKCDIQQNMLLQKIEKVLHPFNKFMEKREVIQNFERLREYVAEVESKVSFEYYNHVGLLKKLKHDFIKPINDNRDEILKILEILKEREEEYDSSGSGIWRKK